VLICAALHPAARMRAAVGLGRLITFDDANRERAPEISNRPLEQGRLAGAGRAHQVHGQDPAAGEPPAIALGQQVVFGEDLLLQNYDRPVIVVVIVIMHVIVVMVIVAMIVVVMLVVARVARLNHRRPRYAGTAAKSHTPRHLHFRDPQLVPVGLHGGIEAPFERRRPSSSHGRPAPIHRLNQADKLCLRRGSG
jgi:hypothetical protein